VFVVLIFVTVFFVNFLCTLIKHYIKKEKLTKNIIEQNTSKEIFLQQQLNFNILTKSTRYFGSRKELKKLTFGAFVPRQSEGATFKTSAFEFL